jgi:hypothetical protein
MLPALELGACKNDEAGILAALFARQPPTSHKSSEEKEYREYNHSSNIAHESGYEDEACVDTESQLLVSELEYVRHNCKVYIQEEGVSFDAVPSLWHCVKNAFTLNNPSNKPSNKPSNSPVQNTWPSRSKVFSNV